MTRIGATGATGPATPDARAGQLEKLKGTAGQLQGLFVQQLFKAMRETVPDEGIISGGNGGEMFQSMFDEKIAEKAPAQWHHGVGSAILSQLARRLPSAEIK
jgi:flagellar protein FlgJ